MSLSVCELSTAKQLLVFLEMSFDLSEFVEQLVVLQNLQVFHVEVGLVVALDLLLGLTGVDTLENAQAAEILQRHLHISNRV